MAASGFEEWKGHVVVCGLDGIGLRIVEQLRLVGVAVLVVDDEADRRLVEVLSGWGVPLLDADPRLTGTLERAGLDGARALVCVERTDLLTLETALLARELRPDLLVVVQLANPGVGRALVAVTGPGSVLDVAELTAPSLVEACLKRSTHGLDIGGEQFVAAELIAARDATLRNLYGDLAPVAVVGAGGDVTVCPGRDHSVVAGDRVTVLGTATDLERAGMSVPAASVRARREARDGVLRSARRIATVIAAEADTALRVCMLALVTLVATSSAVLLLAYRRPPTGAHLGAVDAVYFTVETVATVGFGDFSFAGQTRWLEVFGIVLIVVGATLVTTLFALLTNALVSRRIARSLGHFRVPGMRGHVIVAGFGSVGLRVVERLLADGQQVVVVERDEANRYLERARSLGVPVVVGDATVRETLESVNLSACRALAALTSDDLANIETGLAARDMLGDRFATVPVVLRLVDRPLARTVERAFGFHQVRSTSELAAPWFVGAALGLSIVATFSVERQPFLVARLSIDGRSGLVGLAMAELSARVRVVALRRGGMDHLEHPPRRGTRFAEGDEAFVIGPYEELLAVLVRNEPLGPESRDGTEPGGGRAADEVA
ncbi:MAG TPA: NAD-binding protein [Acidimicrobiales bacterium]|nr:NAD-binding protein [Acidimicrobiales bacterium]